ncbi:hypothetical protein [Pedobacter insulae]|uniref:CarboxypepD_reg-like domain-containing protein n=1 Tax=Pedobacter insulae TaxID=414048 RepID=A0A1I2X795_9SPHI|nr:hypothetical protein [Pedobacter insulae]SFH09413.1 hypothetical protein SAMN04489864_10544 [Pedobacter insulae]
MKLSALFLLIFLSGRLFAQTIPVQGFVIDKDTKARLARVYIYNPANDEGIYNNLKGEFTTKAKVGDTIFAALSGYAMDTVVYNGKGSIIIQLKALTITLNQVEIYGKTPTPQELYAKKLKEYKYALDKGSTKDLLNLGSGGVGLGIDAIYNLLSRQGKNARHLQAILEKDYHEAIIDYRYKPAYVKSVLGSPTFDIDDFMLQYRPTYQFVLNASDYAFVLFIKNSYNSYKRNPATFRLPKLPKMTPTQPLGQ